MWDVYIYFSLLLLNILVWLAKYKHLSNQLKLLGTVILITIILEGYAAYLMFQLTRNLFLYHFLIPVQYIFFSLVFYLALGSKTHKKVILSSIPLYILFSLFITFLIQAPSEFNSYARLLKNILLSCWVLFYYKEVFAGLKASHLNKEPMFWVSTGLLFYSLGSFFVDGLMNHILGESFELANALFYISIFLGFLLYITFLIAFVLEKKRGNYQVEEPSSNYQKRKHA